jgi:hypothetical protein
VVEKRELAFSELVKLYHFVDTGIFPFLNGLEDGLRNFFSFSAS